MKSIIIPTMGKCEEFLKPLCTSIIAYTDLSDIEVVIVSNGSKDNTREYVESLGKPFKLVWFDEGIGYTRAVNEGVKVSKGDILIMCNNDCLLLPQPKNMWIDMLCNPLKDNIGLTCNLKLWDWSVERWFGLFFMCAFPRFIWDRIGGLDEKTWSPGGGEDIEFCLQVEQLGYKILQVPNDEVCKQENGMNVNSFPNYHPGEGTVLSKEFNIENKWEKHIKYVRETLEKKYKLPRGWFFGEDINEYRQLIEDVPEGGTIGELGCAWGRSICSVADIIKRKNLTVHIVDCFVGTPGEPSYGENFREEFENNIKRFGIFDRVTIHEGYTNDKVFEISDGTFDELFIDADHSYEAVKQDIENWLPKIKKHGKISGHDYANVPGVGKAVNEKFTSGVRCNQLQFEIHSGIATSSVWSKRL